jgi:hypothetical protein
MTQSEKRDPFDLAITGAVAAAIGCPAWTTYCDAEECFCLNAARAVLGEAAKVAPK